MKHETDYDRLEDESPEMTLQRLHRLYPVFMHTLESRDDLKGTYVLLNVDGDGIAYVTNYERSRFDPSTITLEPGQILLEIPTQSDIAADVRKVDGVIRWQLRNAMEEFGDTTAVVRPDGLVFEPDYSQLSKGEAQERRRAHKTLPR